jgi:ribose/xylose/arabinose/galactoside ABC-type transport system permease subunit
MAVVAMGVPAWPDVAGGWSLWPLVGVGMSLFICSRVLRLRLGWPVVLASIVAGSLFATSVDAWGVPAAMMSVVLIALSLGWFRRVAHHR